MMKLSVLRTNLKEFTTNVFLGCFIFIFILHFTFVSALNIGDVKLWGPGLYPHKVVMPARYFFIELNGMNGSLLDVKTQSEKSNRPCRMRTNLLNRNDGTFIFRYKLHESCDKLQIIIKYKDEHIEESPYIFHDIYSDDCNCPMSNINVLLQSWECGKIPYQIISDLKPFESVNWKITREEVITNFNSPGAVSLCHYVIKSNNLYRKCYGKYVGFKMFMDSMLLSLMRKTFLPDLEFFVNLGDWPLSKENLKYPIFSWCGSNDTFDIVMPTYDISESTLENMGRVMLDMLSVQGNVNYKWEDRSPKAFWRGRDANRERLKLIDIAREHPDLFNVSLTNFFFFRDEEVKYGPKSEHVSFYSFFDYKYQISIDGTVAAYRLPYLLGGGSLIFKQDSKYYEHFYRDLIPYVHFIPIKKDLSDLIEKLLWAMENDDKSKEIAMNGQKFAVDNLMPKNVFCYYMQLLNEFSKILTNSVEVLDGMEKVDQPKASEKCKCNIKDEL